MAYNGHVRIKIVSYNIHKGFGSLNLSFTLEEIRNLIRETDADLVCLQEVVGRNERFAKNGYIDNQIEFLADQVWEHYSYAKNAVYDHGHHGNMILSKFPIDSFQNIDLSTNSYEQRGILVCSLNIPEVDRKLTVMTTHLNLTHEGRSKQYQKIKKELSRHGGEPVILAGDFNDWNKRASALFEGSLGFSEAHKKTHGKYAKTFPALFPMLSLDRVYVRNMKVLASKVIRPRNKRRLSDHLPLLIELELE